MKKSVLLVGGTGVLSSAVTSELLKKDISVTMINRGNRNIPQGVNLIKTDCNNFQFIKENLEQKKFDAVIDFLCYSRNQLINSFEIYSNYTKQYFFISSCAVYNTELGQVCKEDSPKVLKQWQYSVEKWDCEQTLERLAEKSECKYTIIRPCVTYGDTRIPYGIAPIYGYHWTLVARILADKPIITWNGGKNRVNMLRVEDFAVGVVGLIGNEKAMNEAFNICADDAPTYKEVLDIISESVGHDVKTVDIPPEFYAKNYPSRKGEILGGRAIDALNSNEKIKSVVPEFRQTISIREGIIKTLKAYEEQNYQKGIDWAFDACTDRIIKKWCRKNHLDSKPFHLGFVDYFGTASKHDYAIYQKEKKFGGSSFKVLRFGKRCLRKIIRIVKKRSF